MTGFPATRAELDALIDDRIKRATISGDQVVLSTRSIARAAARGNAALQHLETVQPAQQESDRGQGIDSPVLVSGSVDQVAYLAGDRASLRKLNVAQRIRAFFVRHSSSPSVVDASRVGAAGSGTDPGPDRSS